MKYLNITPTKSQSSRHKFSPKDTQRLYWRKVTPARPKERYHRILKMKYQFYAKVDKQMQLPK